MAFGKQMEALATKAKATTDGETTFETQWMPNGNGRRIFRVLPRVENEQLVLTERINPATGNPVREGNKKTGKVLLGPEPVDEVPFIAAWWQVNVDGQDKPRRMILDFKRRFDNPLWQYIQKHYTNKDQEWKALKNMFAINVIDLSLVVYNDEGQMFYQDERNQFTLMANGASGRIITDKSRLPKQTVEDAVSLRKVRILEGSYGQPNGKHLFQQLADLYESVEDGDGLVRRLPEFDLTLTTKGTGIDTVRTIRNTSNFKPLDDALIALPRYDLATWLKPWDNGAIQDLIDGRDFNETIESYGIQLFPKLDVSLEVVDSDKEDADFI